MPSGVKHPVDRGRGPVYPGPPGIPGFLGIPGFPIAFHRFFHTRSPHTSPLLPTPPTAGTRRNRTLEEHEDAIGYVEELQHVARHHDDRDSQFGETVYQPVNFQLCADVDPGASVREKGGPSDSAGSIWR